MRTLLLAATLAAVTAGAVAKLPPLSDDAKAKAAEAAAKTAYGNKVADFQLCKSMEKVAARYAGEATKAGKAVTPTPTPACSEPGPFAAKPPEQKPIEAAGAHSPPATAASPPSTKVPAAQQPAK
jgi:hypothetical protein